MDLTVGLTARVELTVTDADTAQTVGSGDVPALGTPRVLAIAEAATVVATTSRLPAGATTVGTHIDLRHHAPTAIGGHVVATARLSRVDGRALRFDVVVHEGDTTVADGVVERVVVDRQRFVTGALSAGDAAQTPSG